MNARTSTGQRDLVRELAARRPQARRGWSALLVAVLLGACAQGGASSSPPSPSAPAAYSLTNSQQDAEYLVAWQTVGDQCSAAAGQTPLEGFVTRGEAVELAPGERVSLPQDSPSLWSSTRLLREGDPNSGSFRSLSVEVSLLESDAALQDMVAAAEQTGLTVTGSPVASGVAESSFPGGSSLVGVAAAHRLMVRIGSIGAGETTAYCDRAGIEGLVRSVADRLERVRPPGA